MEFLGDTVEEAIKAALAGRAKKKLPSMGRRVPGRSESAESCREWMTTVVRPPHCKVVALSFQIGVVAQVLNNIDGRIDRLERLVNQIWIETFAEQNPPSVPSGRRRKLDAIGDMVARIILAAPRLRQIGNLKNEIRNLKRAIENLEPYLRQIQRLKDQANSELQTLLGSARFRSCLPHKGAAFPGRTTCFADARRFGYVLRFPSGVPDSILPRPGPL